jgi:hypothetical protein
MLNSIKCISHINFDDHTFFSIFIARVNHLLDQDYIVPDLPFFNKSPLIWKNKVEALTLTYLQ